MFWAFFSYAEGGYFENEFQVVISLTVLCVYFAAFFSGIAISSVLSMAWIIFSLGRSFTPILENHKYGILSTGRMMIFNYALGACLWLFISLSVYADCDSLWKKHDNGEKA